MVTFEEQMKRIEEIVQNLELGNISLEESVAFYKEGAELVADCKKRLKSAKCEIEEVRASIETIEDSME